MSCTIFVLPSIEVGEFVESLPLKFVLMDPWTLNDFHGMVFDSLVCQDWASPVNLLLAVNFTDTDPGSGSYGGIVDLVAKSHAPTSLVKKMEKTCLMRRRHFWKDALENYF